MNKFLLPAVLGVFLIASVAFNIIQYNQTKIFAEKLTFFESHFGTFESLSEGAKQADAAKDKREHTITVYTKTGISESQIVALKNLLETQGGVQSVQYISANQALADFKTKHQNDQLTLQALQELGTNPLGATLTITITDVSQKQSLINLIRTNDPNSIVDKIDS
jgi:cell division protein FtsX